MTGTGFIHLNMVNGIETNIHISDIMEIRQYSGYVNTWRSEPNDEYGAESPFKITMGDQIYLKNGSIIYLRNNPHERIVLESQEEIMKIIERS